jgi:hypothetical protein
LSNIESAKSRFKRAFSVYNVFSTAVGFPYIDLSWIYSGTGPIDWNHSTLQVLYYAPAGARGCANHNSPPLRWECGKPARFVAWRSNRALLKTFRCLSCIFDGAKLLCKIRIRILVLLFRKSTGDRTNHTEASTKA